MSQRASDDAEIRFAIYSIAVIQDWPRLVRGRAIGGIKSGVPQNQRDRFLVGFAVIKS